MILLINKFMLNKRIVLWVSGILTLLLVVTLFFEFGNYCYNSLWCDNIHYIDNFFGLSLFIFPVIFVFTVITFKMSKEVFIYWWKFSLWFISVSILIFFLWRMKYPLNEDGGFGGIVSR